jgi:formylglycine-generating enzyme required for sulfatase activity
MVSISGFIKRLNEKTKEAGWVYRLPREAEWEYLPGRAVLQIEMHSIFTSRSQRTTSAGAGEL